MRHIVRVLGILFSVVAGFGLALSALAHTQTGTNWPLAAFGVAIAAFSFALAIACHRKEPNNIEREYLLVQTVVMSIAFLVIALTPVADSYLLDAMMLQRDISQILQSLVILN
ncbi:hypothetical protein KC614_02190 [candidate division WWE3 bacterium]|uniref:Uncharacterized protein n=1 Tax=candidate division WWE3 bacterium TaxID=2053526 RepID=A0A955RQT5_UNCKA|nr:hypothetical protein [candidate division WWE3 bacterium]